VADVEDPAANLVGIAAAASQGAVTAAQLDARPVMRAGEVVAWKTSISIPRYRDLLVSVFSSPSDPWVLRQLLKHATL
jgi:hypothetical protein